MLALLCPMAAVAVARGTDDTPTGQEVLGIITSFDEEPPGAVFDRAKLELARLLHLSVLRLEWRPLETLRPYESFDHLVLAHFTGRCEIAMEGAYGSEPMPRAMAFTHVSDGEVIPFLEVDCARVAGVLGSAKPTEPAASRDHRMGRALARVLAHEIYHVVAETRQHSRSGIAKAELSKRDLTCEQMTFEQADLDRMRAKVAESMHPATISPRPGTD